MEIENDSQYLNVIPLITHPVLGSDNPATHEIVGIGAKLQGISNTYLRKTTVIVIGMAMLATTVYVTGKAITWSVNIIKDPPPHSGIESYQLSREILNRGIGFGALGGILYGLAASGLANRFISAGNRHNDHAAKGVYCVGATMGLCIGSLAGAIYSFSLNTLQQVTWKE